MGRQSAARIWLTLRAEGTHSCCATAAAEGRMLTAPFSFALLPHGP